MFDIVRGKVRQKIVRQNWLYRITQRDQSAALRFIREVFVHEAIRLGVECHRIVALCRLALVDIGWSRRLAEGSSCTLFTVRNS